MGTPDTPSAPFSRGWDLPAGPAVVGKARQLVTETLAEWDMADFADEVTLIVSELVTNAIVHAAPPISLTLQTAGPAVRGAVTDHGETWPLVHPADEEDEHGRGLGIVSLVAEEWGVTPQPDGSGKTVWFVCSHPERPDR